MTRAYKWLTIPVGMVQIGIFLTVSRLRLIDGDEGFYLLASRLVFQHQLPYRDFFYPQMPLLPYVFGLYLRLTGYSWLSARTLAAILTSALGVLLYIHVCQETRKLWTGLLAVVLFVTSTQVFAWLPIVKTYSLSALLLFAAYLCIVRVDSETHWSRLAAGGLLLGLSVDTRLYFAGLLLVFVTWIYRNVSTEGKRGAVLSFVAGFATGTLPSLYFLVLTPKAYVFNNLLYHLHRSVMAGAESFGQKLAILIQVWFYAPGGNGLQMGSLFVTGFWLIAHSQRFNRSGQFAYWIGASLTFICLLPTPTYAQYFSVTMPFLIVAISCLGKQFYEINGARYSRRTFALAGIGVALASISISIADYRRYLFTGQGVDGVHTIDHAVDWNLDSVTHVSEAIDEIARPGEAVMCFWPGYVFQSTATPYSGLENHAGLAISSALSNRQLKSYHIISQNQIQAMVERKEPRIIVVGNQESMNVDGTPYRAMAKRFGYTLVKQIGATLIFVRSETP